MLCANLSKLILGRYLKERLVILLFKNQPRRLDNLVISLKVADDANEKEEL